MKTKHRTNPRESLLILGDIQINNRALPRQPTSRLIPSDLLESLLAAVAVVPVELHSLIPLAIARRQHLPDVVESRVGIGSSKALHQLCDCNVGRDVSRREFDVRARRQLPRCIWACTQKVYLGVLGWEKVAVSRLTAYTSCAVGHVGRRRTPVQDGIGVGRSPAWCHDWPWVALSAIWVKGLLSNAEGHYNGCVWSTVAETTRLLKLHRHIGIRTWLAIHATSIHVVWWTTAVWTPAGIEATARVGHGGLVELRQYRRGRWTVDGRQGGVG